MPQIGTFTRGEDGALHGTLKTLMLDVEVALRPCDKEHDRSPDYRVFAGSVEFGAAWKKISRGERQYLSLKLDDPCFPAPIYASIVEGDNGDQRAIWSR